MLLGTTGSDKVVSVEEVYEGGATNGDKSGGVIGVDRPAIGMGIGWFG